MAFPHKELTIKLFRASGSSVPQLMVEDITEKLGPRIIELAEKRPKIQPLKSRGPLHLELYEIVYTMPYSHLVS